MNHDDKLLIEEYSRFIAAQGDVGAGPAHEYWLDMAESFFATKKHPPGELTGHLEMDAPGELDYADSISTAIKNPVPTIGKSATTADMAAMAKVRK